MIDLKRHLQTLTMQRSDPSVSIYMPMAVVGRRVDENQIRFKNLLRKAGSLLDATTAESLLQPLETVLSDEDFWRERAPGLAVFHSAGGTWIYRLPEEFPESVTVDRRFYLKPLLALLSDTGRFYILALSRNATRLLEVTWFEIRHLDVQGVLPSSIDEFGSPDPGRKQLQMHSTRKQGAVYHGQGAGEHREAEETRRFLHEIDAGLKKILPDDSTPLVLAGVNELTSAFRSISDYPTLVSKNIDGNVDGCSDEQLRDRAQPLAREPLRQSQQQARQQAENLWDSSRVTWGIRNVVPAAVSGRIDTLFVTKNEQCWGRFDPVSRAALLDSESSLDNEDLLDLAAVRTFETGGRVFVVDPAQMPNHQALAAAILRY